MIATRQPALMTGPYDWHEDVAPRAEFEDRVAQALAIAAEAGADVLLVHGDRAEFGMLAWLSHFSTKLGPALAVFEPGGTPRLLFSGGPTMVGSAERLTWIDTVRALGNPGRELAGLKGRRVALLGEDSLTRWLHREILAAIGAEGALIPIDAAVMRLRRCKSASEQAAMRVAAGALEAFTEAFRFAIDERAGIDQACLAGERAAYAHDAQDVRVARTRNRLQVAVRGEMYWAAGWISNDPAEARATPITLPVLVSLLRAGAPVPVIEACDIGGIGLSLEEPPCAGDVLAVGDALRIDLPNASGIVLIGAGGAELLWSSLR